MFPYERDGKWYVPGLQESFASKSDAIAYLQEHAPTTIIMGLAESAFGTLSTDQVQAQLNEALKASTFYTGDDQWFYLHSLYEDHCIVSCSGKYWQHDFTVSGDQVTLVDGRSEVLMTWAPISTTEGTQESDRDALGSEAELEIRESAAAGAITPIQDNVSRGCILLKAGLNKAGNFRYTPQFIKANLHRFEGSFSYADHPTSVEAGTLPERSMTKLAAVVQEPRWDETLQAAVGDLDWLSTDSGKNMQAAYANPTVRESAGLSIYWRGPVKTIQESNPGGGVVQVPVSLLGDGKFDVDCVTKPTAGGRVAAPGLAESSRDEPMLTISEGGNKMDWTKVTLDELRANRPDLLAQLQESNPGMADVTALTQMASAQLVHGLVAASGLTPALATLVESNRELVLQEGETPEAFQTRVQTLIGTFKTAQEQTATQLRESNPQLFSGVPGEPSGEGVSAPNPTEDVKKLA